MKRTIIYYSRHGHSKRVANYFKDYFEIKKYGYDISNFELILFIIPTYGDEELPLEFEDYFINLDLRYKSYIVCELGNYFGYDEYEWGTSKIISNYLNKLGWREYHPSLSLDSFPDIDWDILTKWGKSVIKKIERNSS